MKTQESVQRIRFVAELRKRWWVLLLCGLVCGGGAYAVARSQPQQFTGQSQVLVQSAPSVVPVTGSTVSSDASLGTSSTTIQDTLQLITAQPMQALVRHALAGKLDRSSSLADIAHVQAVQAGGAANAAVAASTNAPSAIITITATSHSAHDAAAIANAFATQFVSYRRSLDQAVINSVAATTNRELQAQLKARGAKAAATVSELRAQAVDLAVAAGLQTGNVYVLQTAPAPTQPTSPRPVRSGLLGLGLGLAIGLAILLLLAYLDRRVKTVQDVEAILGLPCIGTVPDVAPLREQMHLPPDSPMLEPFRMIYTSLRYFAGRRTGTVALASAVSGEGKTTLARWLATSTGSIGPTILIDADLRKHRLSQIILEDTRSGSHNGRNGDGRTQSQNGMGLSDVILGTVPADKALKQLGSSAEESSVTSSEHEQHAGAGEAYEHTEPAAVRQQWASRRILDAGVAVASDPVAVPGAVSADPGKGAHTAEAQEGVAFLESGTPMPNPVALFARGGFETAIQDLAGPDRTIYVDTPAMRLAADALEIVQRVDTVVLVARLGTTTIDDLVYLRKLVDEHKIPAVGVVVNNVGIDRSYGGYGYGYGSDENPTTGRSRVPLWKRA